MTRVSAVLAAFLLALSLPARAQEGEQVTARLLSFSPWAAPDRPLSLVVEIANNGTTPLEDVAVRLSIRDRVRSRSALRASLDGNASGDIVAVTTEESDHPIAARERATVSIVRDLGTLATGFRVGRATSGVYPVTFEVRVGGTPVVTRTGAFVFMAHTPERRLNVTWVIPIHRPLAADTRNTYGRATLTREMAPTGRLRAMADLLAAHQTSPLTLAPSGLVADQLLDVSDGFRLRTSKGTTNAPATDDIARAAADVLARLRASLASPAFEIASSTYGRASMPRLVAAGLSLDAGRQVRVAQEAVKTIFGRAPTPEVFVDGLLRADTISARTFAALGTKRLVLDPQSLRDRPEGRFGPDLVEDVRAARLSFDAVIADDAIRDRLEIPADDRVLTAMGILAETAASYFERPALADGRVLAIATATMPEPAVARPLLDALSQAPWVQMRTVSGVAADTVLRSSDEPRRLKSVEAENSSRVKQARAARRAVETLESILVPPSGAEATARLEKLLFVSESADYDRRLGAAVSLARAVRDRTRSYLGRITVPKRVVTLTRRGGQVPVTIQNRTAFSIRLRVSLDSQKLTFPGGQTRPIEIEGRTRGRSLGTLTFNVEARGAGSFPITVRLETPDGQNVVGTGEVQVRSSAVSAVTLMATAGGALFLVGAWARRAFTRRTKAAADA